MKIHQKVSLTLTALAMVFIAAFVLLGVGTRHEIKNLLEHRKIETQNFVTKILELKGTGPATFAADYTYWDDMVRFAKTPDPVWAQQNIDPGLGTFKADAAWIYSLEETLLYSKFSADVGKLGGLPVPNKGVIRQLFKNGPLVHFFADTPKGLIEIRGATIHPTTDAERKTPAGGFFFVGRLWDAKYLEELMILTSARIAIVPYRDEPGQPGLQDEVESPVKFSVLLNRWDRQPSWELEFSTDTPLIHQLRLEAQRGFFFLIGTALFFLLGVFFLMQRWVSYPLVLIEKSLNEQTLAPIHHLRGESSEFGKIAGLMENFLKQKMDLEKQMAERKRLEETLVQTQKMEALGRMVGAIAHDFNNQLMVMSGFCGFLAEDMDPQDPKCAHLQEIQKAVSHSVYFTRQLLSFSRRHIVMDKVLDPQVLILNSQEMWKQLIGENIQIVLRLSPTAGWIKFDPPQFEQILINLITNARDAMPKGGKLTIETKKLSLGSQAKEKIPVGDYVAITVADTGIGMDAEVKRQAFEPFFTTKAASQGTGLGLATTYGILQQHHGYIEVESEPGQGSVFTLYLPHHLPEKDSEPVPALSVEKPSTGSETILLAEDEEAVRKLTAVILQKNGYQILEASDGREALEVAKNYGGRIHLLLSDVIMPELNGRELFDRLKVERPEVQVIFMSGYTGDIIAREGVLGEGTHFLQKPFEVKTLLSLVRRILDAPTR